MEKKNIEELEDKETEKTIEELLKEKKKDNRKKRILIIIIIILLLLLWWLGHRLGKIGYEQVSTTGGTTGGNEETTDALIKVFQVDSKNIVDGNLDIFINERFSGKKIIAPKSNGIYKFCVENVDKDNITYNIKFADEMTNFVNMKYKLKIDNVYIRGNKDKYVDLKELNVDDVIVLKDSINMFTLEWYWEDDDEKDTAIGSLKTDEYYTLKLNINASKLDK